MGLDSIPGTSEKYANKNKCVLFFSSLLTPTIAYVHHGCVNVYTLMNLSTWGEGLTTLGNT